MDIEQYLKELFEFLSIPSVSAQIKYKKDVNRAAEFLQGKLAELSFDSQVLQTEGHPVVYAENLSAGNKKPTILVYGHYDVQDIGSIKEWTSDPFIPEIRSGNIYARGAADDKGQLYTWIAAVEEILKDKKQLPVNIKFLIEGEEELGSENLYEFVSENSSLLKANICVISDSHSISETQPLIDYGLRGIVYTEIMVKTLPKDVHSGLYGGNVLNPANVLAQIIDRLKDENHKINIPGFYDDVRKIDEKERKRLSKYPFTEKEVVEETGAKIVTGENGFSVQERAGARPTLDINGIWSGYTQEGQKTIIPSTASAKISMRIVPNQKTDEIAQMFESFIKEITPKGAEVEVEILSKGEPIIMDVESKYFKAAEKALQKVFGNKPVYALSGGSIPVTSIFKTLLDMDSIMLGYGLPDDGLHSPNEKMSLTMFEKGIRTNIEYLKKLSEQ